MINKTLCYTAEGSARLGSEASNIPPVLKAEKGGFQKFKHELLLKTNMLNITANFVGQGIQMVPEGDPLKQKAVLLREDF